MTEPLAIAAAEPFALIAVEAWGAPDALALAAIFGGSPPPAPLASADADGGWRALWVEPSVWWLYGPRNALAARLSAAQVALGERGAAIDLTGGFAQARITGEGWRDLLMVGGVFDAEDPTFDPGRTAGTILHHVAVRYDVVAVDEVRVFAPPSYTEHLLHHWTGGRRPDARRAPFDVTPPSPPAPPRASSAPSLSLPASPPQAPRTV